MLWVAPESSLTGEGGDRVDADGIPLHLYSRQQKPLLAEAEGVLRARNPLARFGTAGFDECRPSGRSFLEMGAAFCR